MREQAKKPTPNRTPYNVSKVAVVGFTRTIALELVPAGINTNAVCPGATEGERIESSIREQATRMETSYEEAKERIITGDTAWGVLMDPSDTAEVVTFLASPRSRHITGQDINVDGGAYWD